MLSRLSHRPGSRPERLASTNSLTGRHQPAHAEIAGRMKKPLILAGLVMVASAGCSSPNHAAPTPSPAVPSVVRSGTGQQVAQAAILNEHDMGPDYRATPF